MRESKVGMKYYSDWVFQLSQQPRPDNYILPQQITDASVKDALATLNQL